MGYLFTAQVNEISKYIMKKVTKEQGHTTDKKADIYMAHLIETNISICKTNLPWLIIFRF